MATEENPTAIIMNGTKYTAMNGSSKFLGEGPEWLTCVAHTTVLYLH